MLAKYSLAERSLEPFKNGCLEQKGLDSLGLAGKRFLSQVVDNVALTPGERLEKVRNIVAPMHRQDC